MTQSDMLKQDPAPGTRRIMFRGDTLNFRLDIGSPSAGTAWVRTNIGQAGIQRREVIRSVHFDESPLGRDWFDLPMRLREQGHFEVALALTEVGHFEAKCYFLPEGGSTPIWPPGTNAVVNVEPADTCCANTLYNAFVRQFGPGKAVRRDPAADAGTLQRLDREGYTVIPPSGTFRDLIEELDFIVGTLGCRLLMLLPIHPTPTTYGRMGRFGSPYAALSFTAVDPALAVFDPRATPLEQFQELVDAVHRRNARIIIDIAINHTGWAAQLHETHPEWLVRTAEGRIEVPGAWGVRWEDLTRLDYRRKELWRFMADVFLKWCRRGVDGFRCDAGYMIPTPAWKYIVARVRARFPDTLFLLEGLGGRTSVTRELLNAANLNWAYSELFQNYNRSQIERYLPVAGDISAGDGITIHFAETHDNPRLAAKSALYARLRTALCALLSHHGAFGFANGVEWLAAEKIDVHDAPPLNWGGEPNLVAHIQRLTLLLRTHPAFYDRAEVRMIQEGEGNYLVVLRHHRPTGKRLLVTVNLNEDIAAAAEWRTDAAGIESADFVDLMSASPLTADADGNRRRLQLAPGQVMCLTADETEVKMIETLPRGRFSAPPRIDYQRRRAKALEIAGFQRGSCDLEGVDPHALAEKLREDPAALCSQPSRHGDEPRVVTWQWPRDSLREVMVPPAHFLLVRSGHPFRARLVEGRRTRGAEDSLSCADGSHFALFTPRPSPPGLRRMKLELTVYADQDCRHLEAPVLFLPRASVARHRREFRRTQLKGDRLVFLAANPGGAALRAPVAWNELVSRYDALLAANLSPTHPGDRWIMLTRCRIWLVFQGYSQQLNTDCLQRFWIDRERSGSWRFLVPCGQGQHVLVVVNLSLAPEQNRIHLALTRCRADGRPENLPDDQPVQIILRPDIESRNFHAATKAYTGPETDFPEAIVPAAEGFVFNPEPSRFLHMKISSGEYVPETEWLYMIHREQEAERGLDPDSDLFSPGYFKTALAGGRVAEVTAVVGSDRAEARFENSPVTEAGCGDADRSQDPEATPIETLTRALDAYVVRRGRLKSVVAGFPWFLDWGRDALIFARGLIAAGRLETAREVLIQFGQFEENGTLPNMIAGSQAANRDTSDAPLWFFTACSDLLAAEGSARFLREDCGGRTVGEILLSIGAALVHGTPNGVGMDAESALIFSPSHFTWMDTNHPAATPREGYPIEIQALWIAALDLLIRIEDRSSAPDWTAIRARAQRSLRNFYWLGPEGYFSDCLHTSGRKPAKAATADDALRPNQLLAITLGAETDAQLARKVLASCEALLVPGAIRSLADRPVRHRLPVYHHGQLLNDPGRPYQGVYAGDEDTRRKPAYHNGTAWTWQFPSYCEAWALAYHPHGRQTALAWLTSSIRLMDSGCIGQLPEIVDGSIPHRQRGCDAQGWAVSEWVRVWNKLS